MQTVHLVIHAFLTIMAISPLMTGYKIDLSRLLKSLDRAAHAYYEESV